MVEYSDVIIKLLTSFLVIILGIIIGNILKNVTKRVIKGSELNNMLKEQLRIKWNIENKIPNIIKYLVYTITFIMLLNVIGISTKILWVVFVIILFIVLLFILLAFRDWLPNLISGIYILRSKKIKRNEVISTGDIKGRVKEISLFETKIETNNNEVISIPNYSLAKYGVKKVKK